MNETPAGRPTLETVARAAGASRATVSRVVNGSTTVRPDVAESIRRAIAELGYVPNPAARSLVTQRTDSIALILPESATRVFSDDAFFPGVIRGVGEALEKADKQLVLLLASTKSSHDRILRYVHGRTVDGVVLASMHGADTLPEELRAAGVPVVTSGRPLGEATVPYIDVEHASGVEAAMRHLVGLGRRRIATIAGPQDMVAGRERLAGYLNGLEALGAAPLVEEGDFMRQSGMDAMERLLARDPDIDGVFAASDLMADGALRTLRRLGRRVPDDVAVIGFDDVDAARFTDPPLTTVHQPIHEIGTRLAEQILRLVEGEEVEASVVLPTRLVIRESA
ncbi:LacI family transcriptional regulator [Nocardioides sp. KC13]|uniref:LacI family transcriptional regulator n=1 Tax=Nocardioides turkmenicus TaxID=2711220 RepID=A0A6M1QU33_9ACTN|nr:LacI family DNA-binding transcriptional regulator [Nocardioides sp. KC13]NGN93413.1 LacI family transcriptional regulator [Nocardioides sp. KC13]